MKIKITQEFTSRFNAAPTHIIRAPGRVNLIGEHTDYNDGFVFPMAIDRAIWMAIRPRDDRQIEFHSVDFDDPVKFSLIDIQHQESWGEYVTGMAWALENAGYQLSGWDAVMLSDIPIGAGLSSSAALEMAVAKAFALVSGWIFEPQKMALIGQQAENEWVGANTGIMDQMIIASAQADHALIIDCRDLSTQQIPLPAGTKIIIMDTATRHSHTDSGYNERREQCEIAAAHFGVSHLRDVTLPDFNLVADELDMLPGKRARHVISENERVLAAAQAMSAGDAEKMGALMNASHISMRDDFEITNDELNIIVELAQSQPGCYGARMTGGGFGGCAVALVQDDAADSFVENTRQNYQEKTGLKPEIYVCKASGGVDVL
jgi:galactokinase